MPRESEIQAGWRLPGAFLRADMVTVAKVRDEAIPLGHREQRIHTMFRYGE